MRSSYEGDSVAALGWVGTAKQQLANLKARMAATGQTQGAFQHALSPDAYCYGYVLPTGMEAIHIVTTPGAGKPVTDETTTITLPDFVSGTVINGYIGPEQPTVLKLFYPTLQTTRVHKDLKPLAATASERLAVDLWSAYAEELGGSFGTDRFSQYTRLKPSMYSGRMRELVQFLMGFGRQPKTSIYDNVKPLLADEKEGSTSPPMRWEGMAKATGRQIAYDYRFSRSHGLLTAQDGSLWLIEIGINRGVIAMPLPLHLITTNPKFRDKLNTVGDVDGITAYDTFGGFPTGEPFPIGGEAFKAAERAGRVITLLPSLSDFYAEWMPYSQAMGWAFNRSGDEAHNTGYKYGDDNVQRGAHYAIRIHLASTGTIIPAKNAKRLKRALYVLRNRYQQTIDAVLWKIDRMSELDVDTYLQQLGSRKIDDVYREIDLRVMAPCGSGSATITPVSVGNLHYPATQTAQPQVKFPDYTLGFVVSHDLRPSQGGTQGLLKCDTTVHVFFLGNELKWVKFYCQPRTYTNPIENTMIGECTFYTPGKYYWKQYAGVKSIPAQFYSNDLDFRAEHAPGYLDFRYHVEDLGFYEILAENWGGGDRAIDPPNPEVYASAPSPPSYFGNVLWRNKILRTTQHLIFDRGSSTKAACVVPLYNREAYYFGHLDIKEYRSYSDVMGHGRLTDPNYGWYETYWDGGAWKSIVIGKIYGSTSPCADVADEGDWVPIGADVKDVCYPLGMFYPWQLDTEWVFTEDPQVRVLNVYLVSGATEGAKKIKTFTSNSGLYEGGYWFWPSPDEFGDYQYIDTTENCFGESQALVYQPDINSGENRVQGSPDFPAMHAANNVVPTVTFIGVVDG